MIHPPEIRDAERLVKAHRKGLAKARKASRAPRSDDVKQRQPRLHDAAYLGFIRRLPCVACTAVGTDYDFQTARPNPVEAAHLRMSVPGKPNAGMQTKPDDNPWTLSLCRYHHALQHASSEREFWSSRLIDPVALCKNLSAVYPDIDAAAQVIRCCTTGRR